MYGFKPDKPFRSFNTYYVLITPTTHKIYAIWGMGKVANPESGKREQELIMQLLTEKYGKEDAPGPMDEMNNLKHISNGDRHVLTKVVGFVGPATIEVRYHDGELAKLANQERLSLEGKKVDSSGL